MNDTAAKSSCPLHQFRACPVDSREGEPEMLKNGLGQLSAESIELLFENAPDAMVVCNAEGAILRVNAETERMFGYMRHELTGATVEILIQERLRHKHQQLRASYLEKPNYRAMSASLQLVGRKKDGTELALDISLNPVISAQGLVLYGIIRDRTERDAAQRYKWEAQFERTLAELSAKFVNLPAKSVDSQICVGLQAIAEALNADRATVATVDPACGDLLVSYAWAGPAVPEMPKRFVRDLLRGWWTSSSKENPSSSGRTLYPPKPLGNVNIWGRLEPKHQWLFLFASVDR